MDRGVWRLITLLPYPVRLAVSGLQASKTPIPRTDMAAVVEAVGSDVTRFRPGDEVFGTGKGAYAEYARASKNKLAPKPATLTFEQAAAVPVSACTAHQGLCTYSVSEPPKAIKYLEDGQARGKVVINL